MRSTTSSGLVVLACGLSLLAAGVADAGNGGPPKKCQVAIARAAGTFLAARVDVLKRCEKLRLQGILPPGIDCTTDNPNAAELEGVAKDLADTIDKACGGADQTCGTPDDVPLSDAGWGDVTQCPDLEHSGCTAPIATCKDVTTCIECVGAAASNQAIKLDYGDFVSAEFGTDSETNQCQEVIGRASTKFLQVLARSLGRCEVTRMRRLLRGKDVGECMGDSGKITDLVAKAEAKKRKAICKACGGDDAKCGTSDDLEPGTFGFASQCPALSVPSGGSCGGAILDLSSVVDCVDCVARFKAECMSALATPGSGPYPPQCNPATATCGNGKLDPGEQCDPGSGSAGGAFPGGSTGGAFPCPGGEVCTAQCTCSGSTPPPTCGNGKLDPGEQCDPGGGSAGGAFPCPGGAVCSPQCTCEGGTSTTTCSTSTTTTTVMCHNMTTTTTSTTTTTQPSTCGNGRIDPGEQCDPSSTSGCFTCPSGDTCDPTSCKCMPGSTTTTLPTPGCGNGVRDPGEQCDPTSPSGAMVCPEGTTCSLACTCVSPSSSTTTTTIIGGVTTTTIPGGSASFLDFTTGTSSDDCGTYFADTAFSDDIDTLGCGGLDIGGGLSTVPEGPTPDGSTSRFTVSCSGSTCTLGPTMTAGATFDCTNTGCRFGAPLPIANGGLSTCVENSFAVPASGTVDTSTGEVNATVSLNSRVVLTGNDNQPCPICRSGSITGAACSGTPESPCTGVCQGSPNEGSACTSTNSEGISRDCPQPAAAPGVSKCSGGPGNGQTCTTSGECGAGGVCAVFVGTIPVNLSPLTTGTATKSAANGSFCQNQADVGCFGDDTCRAIEEDGSAAGSLMPVGSSHDVTLASVFCIPASGSILIDGAASLPGPGATSLPGTIRLVP